MQLDPLTVRSMTSEAPAPAPAPAARAAAVVRPAAPAPAPAPVAQAASAAIEEAQQARAAAAEANQKLAEKGSDLTFEFDDVLGRMIFKLIDRKTNEVLRQIPSKELLEIAHALAQGHDVGALMQSSA